MRTSRISMLPALYAALFFTMGCRREQQNNAKQSDRRAPLSTASLSADAAIEVRQLDIDPVDAPPTATPPKGRGDCKLEYAPRPKRDPNPMCRVEGGEFKMGAANRDKYGEPDERPRHRVRVHSFMIDQYEVTVEQVAFYLNTVKDNHCQTTTRRYGGRLDPEVDCFILGGAPSQLQLLHGKYAATPGTERHPISRATFFGAQRYCEWAGKRLPTEQEWEYAARHDPKTNQDWIYPWGNRLETDRANCLDCDDPFQHEAPVGTFDGTNETRDGSSPFGVHDMAGNAHEFTATCMAPYQACAGACDPSPPDFTTECWRAVRSGDNKKEGITTSNRYTTSIAGFRCAR